MVTFFLAGLACQPPLPTPNTIRGLQVVAVETFPPEPDTLDGLGLVPWVADSFGAGADVIVFVCTPYEGRCVEAFPPESLGLPLSIWARAGFADPNTRIDVAWPLFAAIANNSYPLPAEVANKLFVWVLACTPGLCDLVDRVKADPVPGSEAWESVARDLANPQRWLDELPSEQVSLASKIVPLRVDGGDTGVTTYLLEGVTQTKPLGPNRAPFIRRIEPSGDEDSPWVDTFALGDADRDTLSVRSFVTAGGLVQEAGPGDTGISVLWQEPSAPLAEQDRFVVVDDGRGGTAVWSNVGEAAETCDDRSLVLGRRGDPLLAGEALELVYGGTFATVTARAFAEAAEAEVRVEMRLEDFDSVLLGAGGANVVLSAYDEGDCSGEVTAALPLLLPPGTVGEQVGYLCSLGGQTAQLAMSMSSRPGGTLLATGTQVVRVTLPDTLPCLN